MKKLCIFDFDGTLFDTLRDVAKCFNKTFEILGYEQLDLDFYIKSVGGNINEITSIVLKDKNTPENIELIKNTYVEIYQKDLKENSQLYEGMLDVLEKLQDEGILLAINSNRDSESIKSFVNKYAPHIEFVDIQGHISSKPSKPDPYGVNEIIKKSNVTKEESIYIGDSSTDIQTAKNAEIDCIIVTWGYGVGDVYEDEYPISIVDDKDQLLKSIKSA